MAPRTILGVLHEAQTAPYSGDDLIAAVHHINAVAAYGGIHAKLQAVTVLETVAGGLATAVAVLAFDLRHAGYSPAITDALYVASRLLHDAGGQGEHARTSLEALLNTKIGDLASSGHQVPDSTELNGGH